jgi:RNA polymerase sigma-54 factor
MNSLKPNLSLRVAQRQILTPGLVQMVSVLALNKLELKDMINAEIVENPVLEELEDSVPMLDDVNRREEERPKPADEPVVQEEKKDPFDEIDFGSYFQDYLDPGFRSRAEMEEIERPSFENFLSKPANLTDHLAWQLGAMNLSPPVRQAGELIIGNLNEEGYLIATDDELLGIAPETPAEVSAEPPPSAPSVEPAVALEAEAAIADPIWGFSSHEIPDFSIGTPSSAAAAAPAPVVPTPAQPQQPALQRPPVEFNREHLHEAVAVIQLLDPPGVAARDLRECLLAQVRYHQQLRRQTANGGLAPAAQLLADAEAVIDRHLHALQLKQYKEIARAVARPVEAVMSALEFIRTLDPRPGLRYNKTAPRLIEPDVAFVKQGDEWLVVFNDDDVPQLRLNASYRRLMQRDQAEKDVRNYVKERYKSAIQLIKNIEQRKQTILKVCLSILSRQHDFLDFGIDQLKPMMIKEVAEEIGVHPSTVSRAVANKYVHTPQGVFELRYFFSESVQGPEGSNTSLLILKRRVKKLIEEEDTSRPLTDEQLTRILQSQGIQVTRRTVAKYREDMKIPSTHQRRVKK